VDYVVSLAEAGLTEMRALIFELRPESLERDGLVLALENRIDAFRARHDISIDWLCPGEPDAPQEVKEAVYRVVQEALQNVVKHAQATRVTVELRVEGDAIAFRISDNGVGFDPGQQFAGHLGLKSMRERMTNLLGSLEIESNPTAGTTIQGRIPLHLP
jgi:signal transduction histidine kinase